jgi:tungstate transport system substrate-binding protein
LRAVAMIAALIERNFDCGNWLALNLARAITWYRSLDRGMGPTLNIASGMNAYTLTDRATWVNFNNRQHLEILTAGDPMLLNP